MSSDIQPGDLVAVVGVRECAYGPDTHDGFGHEDSGLAGTVHEVSRFQRAPEPDWPGGWFHFTDGDGCCDGCCRKIQPYQERFARELEACRPVTLPELQPIAINIRKLSPEWNK